MNDKVVIAGHAKLKNTIKAKTNLHNVINGTPSWVVNTGGGGIVYPHYDGSYTVTPSGSVQTLDTSDKVMDNDVTIQAVTQGSATTPATIITADPTISVSSGGLITATVSKTQQITPTVQEGYVSAGTPGNVGVSGSNTEQLSTQGAQTIYPSANDQSIASGKYLTGAQTFKGVTVSGLTADKILQGNVVKIGDADDDDRIMSVTGTAQGGITPTGTKQISITQNGTTTEDVTNYASAEITVNVSGGGGADLSWLASNTPTPSVLNFFYALANGTYEHGEFTLTNIPNNAFVDVFTVSNLTSPQGIMIIDKGFYQGITGLPHQSSEARTFMWGDKSFTSPAADATNKYETISTPANQTATSATTLGVGSFWIMDGTTETYRAYWQWNGKTLQLKGKYSNNNQYTPFLRNRPYIWIVW